jgi:type I restriction enzyme S subunit
MNRYSSYKDSGVSWIGEIPSHWEVKKIGSLFVERREKVSDKEYPALSVSKHGITPQLDTAVKTDIGDNRKKVCKNDFVVNSRSDRKGSCGVSPYTGSVSLINIVLSPRKNTEIEYFHHLFRSNDYIEEFYRIGRGIVADLWTTRYSEMRNIYIPLPPSDEQRTIVDYIGDKTSKIDAYVADKEKEIELLQELKQKTIADAVTKGLNPDAKMKDSGISWIGEIPEQWEVCRMKRVFSEAKEKTTTESGTLLSLSQYTGITLKDDAKKVGMFEAESTIGYNVVHSGQFVMNIMLAWNGSYAVSDYEGIISPSYCVFNFNEDCEKKYFHYLLRLPAYAGAFKTMSKGIIESRLRLYPIYFLAFKTIIPPLNEQQAIVAYIEKKCQKIDKLASELQSEIDYLKEYKQRLIADCVTGQVNVQNEMI